MAHKKKKKLSDVDQTIENAKRLFGGVFSGGVQPNVSTNPFDARGAGRARAVATRPAPVPVAPSPVPVIAPELRHDAPGLHVSVDGKESFAAPDPFQGPGTPQGIEEFRQATQPFQGPGTPQGIEEFRQATQPFQGPGTPQGIEEFRQATQPFQGPGTPQGIAAFDLASSAPVQQAQHAAAIDPIQGRIADARFNIQQDDIGTAEINQKFDVLNDARTRGVSFEQQLRDNATRDARAGLIPQGDAALREKFGDDLGFQGIDPSGKDAQNILNRESPAKRGFEASAEHREKAQQMALKKGLEANLNDRLAGETLATLKQRQEDVAASQRNAKITATIRAREGKESQQRRLDMMGQIAAQRAGAANAKALQERTDKQITQNRPFIDRAFKELDALKKEGATDFHSRFKREELSVIIDALSNGGTQHRNADESITIIQPDGQSFNVRDLVRGRIEPDE